MTTLTSRPAKGAGEPAPARQRPGGPRVTAVLVVRDAAPWLGENLDALARQTRLPDRLVVVDLSSSDDSLEIVRGHQRLRTSIPDMTVLRAPRGTSFGEALRQALAPGVLEPAPDEQDEEEDLRTEWVWMLHDDSAAAPTALLRLLEAVGRSPSVGVAGPKVVQWDNPRNLVEVGHQLTRSGRPVAAPRAGEPDQGQYDTRTDVLAVGTCGMLVRRDVFEDIGGFDPAFAEHGGALDFGWRAQLAGHRVIVVPGAQLRDASPVRTGVVADAPVADRERRAARRAVRRAARRVALTRCATWAAPLLALWIVLSSAVAALLLLLLKRPRHAWAELSDVAAVFRPWSGIRSRWRARRTRRLRRRHLTGLFVTPAQAALLAWDRLRDAGSPQRQSRRGRLVQPAASETGPVAEGAEDLTALSASLPQRMATHPGLLATLTCAVVAGVTFRDALVAGVLDAQGAGLAGGELRGVSTDSAGLWHAFRDSWHGAGLGTAAGSGPHLAVLSALSWLVEKVPYVGAGRSPVSVTIAWLLLGAMPLSAATAYLAGRVATRARWPRALAGVAWGSSAVLAAALGSGRLTVVLAHILLPFVVAGFALSATRTGSSTATFATALATGVVGALVPPLLVVSVAAAALMLLIGPGPGRRLRSLVLLVVPTALLGPWLSTVVHDPLLLLAGPGLLEGAGSPAGVSPPWQLALGQPDGGSHRLALLAVPLVVVGILSLARHTSDRARSAALTALALLVLVGLGAALVAPRVILGEVPGTEGTPAPATLWAGVGLDVYVGGLLGAVLLGSRGLGAALGPRRWGPARLLTGLVVVALAASLLALAGVGAWRGLGSRVTVGQDALPAVAVDQARGPQANRLLVLVPTAARVDYQLVGAEPGQLLRDLGGADPVGDPGLDSLVGTLASAPTGSLVAPGAQLADQGIGFVSLRGPPEHPLVRSLDAASGLTRLGATGGQTLWRVLAQPSVVPGAPPVPPSRVRVVDSRSGPIRSVDVAGPHGAVDADVAAGPPGRAVVFAEPLEWARFAEVSYDGQRLRPVSGSGSPTFLIPSSAGRLVADLPPTDPRWFLGQLALLAVTVFLAVPFGHRRSRRQT